MKTYSADMRRRINPVRLADDTIYALSSIVRNRQADIGSLKSGIELSDYLIELLEDFQTDMDKNSFPPYRLVGQDMKSIKKLKITKDEVIKIKMMIKNLIEEPSSHTNEEIRNIQKTLLDVTMPMWQKRSIDFRKMKMKKGFILDD